MDKICIAVSPLFCSKNLLLNEGTMVVFCKNHELCSRDQEALLQEPSGSLAGTMERCSKNHRALQRTKGPVSELLNHWAMMQGSLLQKIRRCL
jgi:hypothetical protein